MAQLPRVAGPQAAHSRGAPRPGPTPLGAARPRREPAAPRAKDPESQAQSAVDGGLVNPQFASVLAAALQRSGGEKAMLDQAAGSLDEERGTPLKPVEEMLMTAIHNSRASLRRLMERQSLLEAEIANEQKQAKRLEWLLNRVRSDYSYFAALDKMNQSE